MSRSGRRLSSAFAGAIRQQAADERCSYILVDTPGQIEIFTWSASGAIITDAIASALPTVICYVIDTPRTTAPSTFMSNMLYACSILYKTRLPFLLVFNKTDVQSHQFALEWMHDFEAFQNALASKREEEGGESDGGGGDYMSSLMNSMSLVLDEFYQNLRVRSRLSQGCLDADPRSQTVGCSAMTGFGMKEFFDAVEDSRQEYETDYKPELDRRVAERAKEGETRKAEQLSRLVNDMKVGPRGSKKARSDPADPAALKPEEIEAEEAEFEQEDGETLDKRDFDDLGPGAQWNFRKRNFPGVEEDGMGGRWPAPR